MTSLVDGHPGGGSACHAIYVLCLYIKVHLYLFKSDKIRQGKLKK